MKTKYQNIILILISIIVLVLWGCQPAINSNFSDNNKTEKFVDYKNYIPEVTRASSDIYEEDDYQSYANVIIVNGDEQSHNFFDDPTDWLKFDAQAGSSYTIETWVYGYADTILYLYDGSNLITSNDDKAYGDYGSLINSWTASETKTYYIKISSYASRIGANRDYVVKVTKNGSVSGDSYEEDDTQSLANWLNFNETQNHDFYDDPTDWLKINATNGNSYTIETTLIGSSCDTVLYVYDTSNNQIAYNDDKVSGDYSSLVNFTATYTGVYYIKVYSYNGRTGSNREYSIIATEESSSPPTPAKWTILVYLDGDNNLSSYSSSDVSEMEAVGTIDDVNVILLWDNSSSTHGYYRVHDGQTTLLQDLGEINMGSVDTAKNFIDFVVANYPAEHYMWDYWNHGGAVDRNLIKGVCWDDTNNSDHLTEVEQKDIMSYFANKIGKKVDVVGFDACLMATAEIVYQYKDYADYMVFSEQTEPGDGWDYSFLNQLKTNPNSTALEVANAVWSYYKSYYSTNTDCTFSVADLSYANDLGTAINDFANQAINGGDSYSYFNDAANFNDFSGYTKDFYMYMLNIYNNSSISSTTRDKAYNVLQVIDNLIVNEWHGSKWNNIAYGLSMTLKSDTSTYSLLDLCVDTSWDEFCTFAQFPDSY